jgi:hypothetical protein
MKPKRFLLSAACISLLSFVLAIQVQAQKKQASLATLTQDEKLVGFKAVAVYLNDVNKPMGGRVINEKKGFTLDVMQI